MSTTETVRLFVTAADRITHCENNLVDLKPANGELLPRLEPRRLFPVSRATTYITLLTAEGKEAAVIRDLRDLDEPSREVIRRSLDDYYLVPHIRSILAVSEKYGTLHWQVDTDRGVKEFDIRNRHHDIRVYKDGCVRVRDSDDNRYIIPDYHALDKQSRRHLMADL